MAKIIDADGHIVEPRTFWNDWVEPQYRDRLPRVVRDPEGIDRFAVGDRIATGSVYSPAAMCIPGGLATPKQMGKLSWDDLRPGSFDPHARLQDMDAEGIDVSVLFPSMGLMFVGLADAEVAAAGCRAYNKWMAAFCRVAPNRWSASPRCRWAMSRWRSRRCGEWSGSKASRPYWCARIPTRTAS